ncbi:MAG: hypothetical protein AB7C89_06665 [Intestinibacillus sp.]
MKRFVLSTLLCFALLLACTAPAFAYQVYSWGEIGPDDYTTEYMLKNRGTLEDRKLYQHEHASFSEGLLRIFQGTEGTPDNFIDISGNLIDLNRGRFDFMSTFSGGLSSVSKYIYDGNNNHVTGFVNKNGAMVLDTSKYGSFHYYRVMTSRFVNGKALLSNYGLIDLKDIENRTLDERLWEKAEFVVIDTKGKVLETIKGVDKLVAHPLFKTSITNYDGVPLGVLMDPMAYAGTSGGGSATEPVQSVPETSTEYQRPDLPDYADAETYFQSKGKITNIYLGDLDFGSFILTITNSTNSRDSGVIAVAAANADGSAGGAGVFFVPYVLEPNSSSEYSVLHRDIIHQYMFDDASRQTGLTAEALKGQVDARVIHFEDDDDLWNFYDSIPYEQNWTPQNLVSEFRPVCSGEAGKAFLKQLRIDRAAVASGDHSFCTPE